MSNAKKCLIVVDMQNDFLNGSLTVPGGVSLIPKINHQIQNGGYNLIVFTQDWHPENHISFCTEHNLEPLSPKEINGKVHTLWPIHCVENTAGAELHPELVVKESDIIIHKGVNREHECYSGFVDDGGNSTQLKEILLERDIKRVDVCGVALDYCVSATCTDSKKNDFDTYLLIDCTASVNSEDGKKATQQLIEEGIQVITTS